MSFTLSNGDLSGLLTAQDDKVRKARRPSVMGKGAARVSEDGMGSGCNLPAKLTRLLGSGYGPGKSRRAKAFKSSTSSWPGLERPHPWLFQLIPQQPPVLRVPFQHGCLRPLRFCSTDLCICFCSPATPTQLFSSKHIFHIKTIFLWAFPLTLHGNPSIA